MDNSADDKLGERFAILTAALEDAATSAIKDQGRDLSVAIVMTLTAEIEDQLESSRQILGDINTLLNRSS